MKFNIIRSVVKNSKLTNIIRHLCKISGISRSGYYNHFSAKSIQNREKKEVQDKQLQNNILKAFKYKVRKKGAKQIKMILSSKFNTVYNLKRIRRIMKKYNIVCTIRRANPYKRMAKATKEHSTVSNLLERKFKQQIPGKVLLTDITYLTYGKGKRAYLSTIKDGSTNEILAYNVSDRITLAIAIDTIHKLKKNNRVKLTKDSFIHSDQGVHYTHPEFQKIVKKYNIGQSMSRRGSCWDNAPQESFFWHFKDEAYIKECMTLDELKKEIKRYMTYYNNDRCQSDLERMTPVQYRNHLLAAS